MSKAMFWDLDGTIIEPKGDTEFPKDVDDWKFKKYVLNAMIELYEQGYNRLIIVTNQGGIPDFYNPADFKSKIETIIGQIFAFFDLYYHYSHELIISYYVAVGAKHPYRKPNPEFYNKAHAANGFIDKESAVMIGDAGGRDTDPKVKGKPMDSDKQFAKNAGIKFIHIDDLLAKTKEKYENKTN